MMQQAGAPNFFINSYTGAPHGRDYERWREELCRCMCRADIKPSEGNSIHIASQPARGHPVGRLERVVG
ncbi:hypothetical protein Q2941_35410 [Bradyrhizobium sp. UFLA05-153]